MRTKINNSSVCLGLNDEGIEEFNFYGNSIGTLLPLIALQTRTNCSVYTPKGLTTTENRDIS